MNFWKLMVEINSIVIAVLSNFYNFLYNFNFYKRICVNRSFNNNNLSKIQSLYIILNGPSLKKQNLLMLEGENLVFVNRGFKHKHYKVLKPKFHVFVDPKILSGKWPISWIYEIVEMVPDIIILMPAKWMGEQKIIDLIKNKVNIIWLPNSIFSPFSCLGVSGAAIKFAINLKIRNIFLTGFDANGLGYELIKSSDTHFYGNNMENNIKTCANYVQDLYMFSRFLKELINLSKIAKKKGFKIYNLTDGGVLDMFERREIGKHYDS